MSKDAVIRINGISPKMSEYMKDMFETAIFTDLHIFKDEPDAMIGLITFEAIAADIDKAIQKTLISHIVDENLSEVLQMLMKVL
jgi:hypothetical protein